MKLQVSNANAPVWRDMTIKSDLPSQLKPLEVMSGYGTARENLFSATLTPICGVLWAKTL